MKKVGGGRFKTPVIPEDFKILALLGLDVCLLLWGKIFLNNG